MPQAANVIPLNNWDRKHAGSFRELECDICDLSLMAELAVHEIERILGQADLPDGHYDRGMFPILHLGQMINALKQKYYSELESVLEAAR